MKHQLRLSQIKESQYRGMELYDVQNTIRDLGLYFANVNQEMLFEYVPVKIVACLQEFFRNIYKDFIDDPKYRKNITKLDLFKDIVYDAEILAAFQDEDITLGEYISYLIPCSKFEDINKTISILAEVNFSKLLHKQVADCDEMLNNLHEIFTCRHIVCHEVPQKYIIKKETAEKWIESASAFVELTDTVVMDIKYPNPPITTYEMLQSVQNDFVEAETELNSLLQNLRTLPHGEFESISFDYINEWEKYREAKAEAESATFKGGSYYGIIYTDSLIQTTKEMIKNLKVQYRQTLKLQLTTDKKENK